MSGNDDKVLLDLNYPAFQSELFEMDAPEIKKIFKTFKKLRAMSWNEVFRASPIIQIQSFRAKRGICFSSGARSRFFGLRPQNDNF